MKPVRRERSRGIFPTHSSVLFAFLALLLGLAACAPAVPAQPPWSGAWVQAKTITSAEKIDQVLDRAEAGGFDAIFVNIFYDGLAYYDSALVPKSEKIDEAFDPLAYLVPEAHRRGIEVHAWFVVGRMGDPGDSPAILVQHPEWALIGPDGESIPWLDLAQADVRQFVGDLMLETVDRYGVDGVHFDYTRYPGPEWGFNPETIQAFEQEYGLDLNQLRYADLPAYGLFESNPLALPGTAQVLASFSNGYPAVTLNGYGEGEVLLLNWKANQRNVAFGSEVMQRGLQRLMDRGGQVALLHSETNAEEYGYDSFESGRSWLRYLGWEPAEVGEAEIASLDPESVLVLPNVYLISKKTAASLADFVRAGGGLVFVDGPTRSLQLALIRDMTGLSVRGGYSRQYALITANGEDPLIPVSQRDADLKTYQVWDADWKEFRQREISALIRDVSERVKRRNPDVAVSVTITSDQEEAGAKYMQDWRTWLQAGYIDFLVPRAYVDTVDELGPVIKAWRPVLKTYPGKIQFGLIAFVQQGGTETAKPPSQMLAEAQKLEQLGSNGIMIFDLGRMSDAQLATVKANFPK